MTTLHDRLADLAQGAPPGAAAAPDLWSRGRRHGRRRTARHVGAVLAVALVAAICAAGLAGRPARPVEPAAPGAQTVLPNRFFTPSGRLPVAHAGTGPLVAVSPAEHLSWWGQGEPGLVGVSAVDQQYSFLDLSRWIGYGAGVATWSLAPNGRWLAYWYGDAQGDTTGSVVADGLAVLDTSTGRIRKHALGGELGVIPTPIGWTGDAAWFAEEDLLEQTDDGSNRSRHVASWSWDLADATPRQVADPDLLLSLIGGPAGVNGFLVPRAYRWCAVHEPADLTCRSSVRFRGPDEFGTDTATISPDDRTVVFTGRDDVDSPVRMFMGTVAGTAAGDDTGVTELSADVGSLTRVLGWLDNDTLLVQASRDSTRELDAVDTATGATRTLSTFEQSADDGSQLATDQLRSRVVDAKRPPDPHNPRVVALWVGGGLVVLLFLLNLVVVVRRARA